MCALINRERKARAKKRRRQRREEILGAARSLFARQPYGSVTMDIIGRRLGVAKGLASLHFATREELFLEVLRRELDDWFDFLQASLDGAEAPLDGAALGRLIAEDLASRGELTGMLRSMHCALEENVEVMPAQTFTEWLRRRALGAAEFLERGCSVIGPGEGIVFLRRLAVVVIGSQQTSALSGIFSAILLDDDYAALRGDSRAELSEIVTRLLA